MRDGKRALRQLLPVLLENIPALVTVIFAAVILLLSISNSFNNREILLWILATAGLLATSMLLERIVSLRRLESLAEQTNKLVLTSLEHKEGDGVLARRASLEV